MTGTLIVGAGQGGAQAALSLRDLGYEADITIVGSEPYMPYQRPPLSKAFLTGSKDIADLQLRKAQAYQKLGITVLTNSRIVDIELPEDPTGVGRATSSDGRTHNFEYVVLSVGGRPRRLTIPGADAAGLHYLRTIDDATALSSELDTAENIVIIGGGFVGLEVASLAGGLGKSVTLIEAAPHLLGRAAAPELSDFLLRAHRATGTTVNLNVSAQRIVTKGGRVSAVQLDDGTCVPAQLVVVGIGMEPRVELAQQLGLSVANGIVVDKQGRTSHHRVFAVGDCTIQPHPVPDQAPLRLESVHNSITQAKAAAAGIMGCQPEWPPVPWFWSTQGHLALQMVGLIDGYDRCQISSTPAADKLVIEYYRGDQLLSVHAVNEPGAFARGRKRLTLQSREFKPTTAA
ncbi:NAD(P)/FAD-dependent oxidoreductase [Nocardia sp. BMG51109]|uniref:NAD(P)/FAD-dependent oxidoreductase n=1 Tax=Nocardia sp. BMG51109 TaxID=1056816 RepID=UPI000465FA21|nr:FAD-dependent oxidoreductase [Nocardia sp. BMG51109]